MKKREIPFAMPYIDDREIDEVVNVLKGKWITTGEEVTKFEGLMKEYLGVNTAVAVSSGTAALDISLAVNGVGEGHEVLTTAYTFAATALSIIHRGAVPVFADVEPDSFNIDPHHIERIIKNDYQHTGGHLVSKKTGRRLKGLLPVHFGGQPADMERINEIAREYDLFVIEDAAHAVGAEQHNVKIGKTPNFVCFSFYSNKNLTTGEGGMIVTDRDEVEPVMRQYSLHGISKDAVTRYKKGLPFYDIVRPGFKANLTDIQAALGVVQVKKLPEITRLRNRAAQWYDESLAHVDGITLPKIKKTNLSARHLYPILLDPNLKTYRDEVITQLRQRGIYPSVHFIPVHFHTFFKEYFKEKISLPVTEDLFHREISLPLFPELKKDDVRYVAEALGGTAPFSC